MTGTGRARARLQTVPLAFLVVFFVWPVAHMLVRYVRWGDVVRVVTDPSLRGVAWFTLWQAVVSTVLTLVIGLPVTWAVSRWAVPGSRLVHGLVTAPFLMPAVVVATGVAAVIPGRGIPAILWAHTVFNVAVVLHLVGPRWRMVGQSMEDAAADLGATGWRTFMSVVWPEIRGAVINAASVVFAFCFSSFAVVSILGGATIRTLETEVFTQAVRLGDVRTATALAVVQTTAVVITLWLGRRSARNERSGDGDSDNHSLLELSPPRSLASRRRFVALPAVTAWAGTLVVVTPLGAVALRSVRTAGGWGISGWRALFDGSLERAGVDMPRVLLTSAKFAVTTAVLATVLALLTTRRTGVSPAERVSFAPLVVSAVTLGLGLIVTFDRAPWDWRGRSWLLPVIHTVIALPLAVRTIGTALRGIDGELFHAAADLGASPLRVWWTIEMPLLRPAIVQAAGISAAVSLGEFGATSFLSRSESMTVPIAIGQLMGRPGTLLQQAAFALATLVAAVTTIVIGSAGRHD